MPKQNLLAQDVARYYLGIFDEDSGDNISNLKLQKLLYYSQGFHLAMHSGEPLFPEPLLAWDHGPVVEPIYHQFKSYRWQGIDRPEDFDINAYPPEVRELLTTVYRVYGQFTAKALEDMTHKEPPWNDTPRNQVISHELMRAFFSALVESGRREQSAFGEPIWPTNSFRFQRRRAISDRMTDHRDRLGVIARQAPLGADPWAGDDH
jgi:uncharacterized phage-associated protein